MIVIIEMKVYKLLLLFCVAIVLNSCGDLLEPDGAVEIMGIEAEIDGQEPETRAVDKLTVTVGRAGFVAGDEIMFTTIRRTQKPLVPFSYSDIGYKYDGKSWERPEGSMPEKIYWTDGVSAHTFIGYALPSQDYHWVKNGDGLYEGELGYNEAVIDYTSGNESICREDLLLDYDPGTVAETGGLSTKVRFTHALSNVRIVVNIKNYAASSSAVDTKVEVSDMILLGQPALFKWGEDSRSLKVLDFSDEKQVTKDIRLWCPVSAGEGTSQSRTFTFYGLTTPQDATFHGVNGNDRALQFSFTVTYPDPMNPDGAPLVKTYSGEFADLVNFNSGMCTTLNISLNHRDEQIFTDAEYSDWNFVSTPDLGELRKKSTFLDMTRAYTTHDMASANEDDATWLYIDGGEIKDVYGNDGSMERPYRISSSLQMLSFAAEVTGGLDFKGKYVRLDADITMQSSISKTRIEDSSSRIEAISWVGIGDENHAFEGTFLGGDRYVNRLYGKPLFVKLGENACVEQVQVTTIGSIDGGGALCDVNAGIIGGCRIIDDVTTSGGAVAGVNSGIVYACCHVGVTSGVAGLVGSNSGSVVGCYQAGEVSGGSSFSIVGENNGLVDCPVPASLHEIQTSGFVDELNDALSGFYASHSVLRRFIFTYSPADYPSISLFLS